MCQYICENSIKNKEWTSSDVIESESTPLNIDYSNLFVDEERRCHCTTMRFPSRVVSDREQEAQKQNYDYFVCVMAEMIKKYAPEIGVERQGYIENTATERLEMPFWLKLNLTKQEAAAYSNIGINRIEEMLKNPKCPFVLYVGTKKLVKRKEFEQYIAKSLEI